jgi:hypothetical protein
MGKFHHEQGEIWKEVIMVHLKMLSWHLPEEYEENYKKKLIQDTWNQLGFKLRLVLSQSNHWLY